MLAKWLNALNIRLFTVEIELCSLGKCLRVSVSDANGTQKRSIKYLIVLHILGQRPLMSLIILVFGYKLVMDI